MDPATLAFALAAGAVAAFNPCGFALLPAYLGLLVRDPGRTGRTAAPGDVGDDSGDADSADGAAGPTLRAVRFAAGMTVGFVAVFGLVGAVLAPLALSIERYLPIVTLVMGVALVGVGVLLLAGRHVAIPGLAGHGRAPTTRWWSQIGYGVSFAAASLSCTIGPFLAVTAGSLRSGGPLGVATVFLAYALGMGTVVLVLALAVAAARTSVVAVMRRAGALVDRAGGALLVLAGAYVAWYGWFEIRVLGGQLTADPVVAAAARVQGAVAGWVADLGPAVLLGVAAALIVLVAALLLRSVRGAGTRA